MLTLNYKLRDFASILILPLLLRLILQIKKTLYLIILSYPFSLVLKIRFMKKVQLIPILYLISLLIGYNGDNFIIINMPINLNNNPD